MLRTRNDQPMLWESLLAPELLRLPEELSRVDALLDDERFFAPFRPYFDSLFGRPSIPMETYLRLMFLKFRYRLGCESLCAEVADSIGWRLFTRIGIGGRVPHPTTLMKITTRCGSEVIEQLNEALLVKAVQGKLLRVGKVRADTTVVSANVERPTDSGLLSAAIGKLSPWSPASRPPVRRRARGGATGPGPRADAPARSVRSCGCVRPRPVTRPRRPCCGSSAAAGSGTPSNSGTRHRSSTTRWRHRRPHHRGGQPSRRAAARAGHRPHHPAGPAGHPER